MNDVLEEISDYHNGDFHISLYFGDSALEDPEFISFLSAQIAKMFENGEYSLLKKFLSEMEHDDTKISEILDVVTKQYESVTNLDVALQIKSELELLEYYNANLKLIRSSGLVVSYIDANGIEEITTTPGTGFYANEKDTSYRDTVGVSGSPLYDAERTTYRGDFAIKTEYGVELNSQYKETSYSFSYYYFRDHGIPFSPDDGECIYSGDYLFCFASNGTLIGYRMINRK